MALKQKEKELQYEREKRAIRIDVEMRAKMRLKVDPDRIAKRERQRQRYLLEIKALSYKLGILRKEARHKLDSIERVKADILRLRPRETEKAFEWDPARRVERDAWIIGALGMISRRDRCKFHLERTFEDRGWLEYGDKIVLLSLEGMTNRKDCSSVCCQVLVVKARDKKCIGPF